MEFALNGLQGEDPGVRPSEPAQSPSQSGAVFRSFLNALFVEFVDEESGESCLAAAVPGKTYLNGRRNMLAVLRTPGAAAALFPPGTPVRLRAARAREEQRLVFLRDEQGRHSVVPEAQESGRASSKAGMMTDAIKRLNRVGTDRQVRTCSHVAVQVWSEAWGQEPPRPEVLSGSGKAFSAATEEAERRTEELLRRVHCGVLSEAKVDEGSEAKEADYGAGSEPWFLVSHLGPEARSEPRWPEGQQQGTVAQGTVFKLLRPHGGIVAVGSESVYFHRSRVMVDDAPIGYTDVMDEQISVGDQVVVRIVHNSFDAESDSRPPGEGENGGTVFDHCPTPRIALWVLKGGVSDQFPGKLPEEVKALMDPYKIKITELVAEEDGRVSSGVGVVCMPSQTQISFLKPEAVAGKYVFFDGRHLTYFGLPAAGADLAQFLRINDEMQCQVREMTMAERQKVGHNCHYCVTEGTFSKMDRNNTALGSWPRLLPYSNTTHINLHRRSMHFEQLEKALLRRRPPLWKKLEMIDMVPAAVTDYVEPAEEGAPMSEVKVTVLHGAHKGSVLALSREDCTAFGRPMTNADLSACLLPYDTVYLESASLFADSSVARKAHVGLPVSSPDPAKMSLEERLDLLVWLQTRKLTMLDFVEALNASESSGIVFVPFPREILQGRMVNLAVALKDGEGNVGGILSVDQGYERFTEQNKVGTGMLPMRDQQVFVPRSTLYVFGHRTSNVDVSFILARNQKLTLETTPLTPADREKYGVDIPRRVKHRATIAWVGPTRPRGNRERDPSRNDVGIKEWLFKRSLTVSSFEAMVSGKEPVVENPAPNRDREGFTLNEEILPYETDESSIPSLLNVPSSKKAAAAAAAASEPPAVSAVREEILELGSVYPDLGELPIFRHGLQVAEMLETAVVCTGPTDPSIRDLIEDDHMAQQAHHVSQALQFALDFYKEKRGFGAGAMVGKRQSPAPAAASNGNGIPKALGELAGYSPFGPQSQPPARPRMMMMGPRPPMYGPMMGPMRPVGPGPRGLMGFPGYFGGGGGYRMPHHRPQQPQPQQQQPAQQQEQQQTKSFGDWGNTWDKQFNT